MSQLDALRRIIDESAARLRAEGFDVRTAAEIEARMGPTKRVLRAAVAWTESCEEDETAQAADLELVEAVEAMTDAGVTPADAESPTAALLAAGRRCLDWVRDEGKCHLCAFGVTSSPGHEEHCPLKAAQGPHDRADCPCEHPYGTSGPCAGCNCADGAP